MLDRSDWRLAAIQIVADAAATTRWTDKVTAIGTALAAVVFLIAAVGACPAYDQLKESRLDRHVQIISELAGVQTAATS